MAAPELSDSPIAAEPMTTRRRLRPTLLVTSIVSMVVMGPLLVASLDARSSIVDSDGLSVSVDGKRLGLDGASLMAGEIVTIDAGDIDDVEAIAWALAPVGAEPLDAGTSSTPPFVVDPTQVPMELLSPGRYELLVTVTRSDGTTVRRAARFAIAVPA